METETQYNARRAKAAARMPATRFAHEQWHVRWWTTCKRRNRRQAYGVFAETHRNVSGTPIANFKTQAEAQAFADRHNAHIKPVTRAQVLQAKTVADMQKLFPTGNPAAQALATILRRKR